MIAVASPRWFRTLVERVLPWYDPEEARARDENTERIRQESIRARIAAEKVRADYAAMGKRLQRR